MCAREQPPDASSPPSPTHTATPTLYPSPAERRRSASERLRRALYSLVRAGFLLLNLGPLLLLALPLTRWEATHELWWRWCVRTAERSGALVIKLAQWASSRVDFFGQEVCSRFVHLQDHTPPHAWHQTEAALSAAFGATWRDVLRLEPTPIGSGCIAQVYRGRLRRQRAAAASGPAAATTAAGEGAAGEEGEWVPVAVKVLHPGVRPVVAADLDLLRFVARSAVRAVPSWKWLNPTGMVEDFAAMLTEQLDLRVEARNLEHFHRNFQRAGGDAPLVIFPAPLEPYCTADVLVETFIEGEPLLEWERRQPRMGADAELDLLRHRMCNRGIDAFIQMLFEDNFVHGDLHPGNILVTPRGELAFLDAGICVRYSDADHAHLVDVLAEFIKYDGSAAARLMMAAAEENETVADADGFARKIDAMVLMARDAPTFFDKIGECVTIICNAACDHRVKMHRGFISIAISTKAVEGSAIALDPMAVIAPRAKAAIVRAHARRVGRAMLGRSLSTGELLDAQPDFASSQREAQRAARAATKDGAPEPSQADARAREAELERLEIERRRAIRAAAPGG